MRRRRTATVQQAAADAPAVEAPIDMRPEGLVADPFTNLPVLVLTDGRRRVAIDVGLGEAQALASELAKVPLSRPGPHDLLKTVLAECGAVLEGVLLSDVRAGVVHALIDLRLSTSGGAKVAIDARPSDAIALALRGRAPIRVAPRVIRALARHRRRSPAPPPPQDERNPPALGDALSAIEGMFLLESLRDEDFGKWKM